MFNKGVEPEKPSLRFEDIEAEVTESEAHTRYAAAAVAFIVSQMQDSFDEATAQVPKRVDPGLDGLSYRWYYFISNRANEKVWKCSHTFLRFAKVQINRSRVNTVTSYTQLWDIKKRKKSTARISG